jgi:hypothetical protein
VAGQPDRPTWFDRLGERRQPAAVLDEGIDGRDDGSVTLGEPVADLVEGQSSIPALLSALPSRW